MSCCSAQGEPGYPGYPGLPGRTGHPGNEGEEGLSGEKVKPSDGLFGHLTFVVDDIILLKVFRGVPQGSVSEPLGLIFYSDDETFSAF